MTAPNVSADALRFLLECVELGEGGGLEIICEEHYDDAEELVDAGLMTRHKAMRLGDASKASLVQMYRLEPNGLRRAGADEEQIAALARELRVEGGL